MAPPNNMDLRSTLNLPDPAFTIPMKADLSSREPERQRHWDEINVYTLIQQARRGRPKFILHDGPPYTNGPVHIGTALNKALKDFVLKYKTLRGFHAPYVPGYDNHGLPIELAVQAKIGKNISPEDMRKACRAHAFEYIKIQTAQFKRLGVFGDWNHRYATMDYGYEATIVRAFARLAEKGYIYRDLRPTHWSTYSRTALADTELVYEQHKSRAIYVRFPCRADPKGALSKFAEHLSNIFVLIWTTTPWTIPGNLAVAFHPQLDYALINVKGDYYILYEGLVESVMSDLEIEAYTKVGSVKGLDLEGVVFKHPIFDRDSIAVLADYVTTEDGTGVVHTAPGHGSEDFYTGRRYGLPILCPVDEAGIFTSEAGEFAGTSITDADQLVPKRLTEEGNLLKAYDYIHNYPYSERDGHPVIFRTTEQWFLKVDHDNLRTRALEEIAKITWLPEAGASRITAMITGRPDWCLSRQRVWGVGIPIIYGIPSRKPVLDIRIMERVAQVVEESGSDAWFSLPLEKILPPNYTHPETGETHFTKETDVLDVWFDSGITHLAVLRAKYNPNWEDLNWPADLYLEGSDQHRGWFNSSLMTAIAIEGAAPYRQVLTHGFVVDEKGEKMSKSKGNVVEPIDAANTYGADILRLWAATVDYRNDVPCGANILKQVGETYRRIRNTLRFLLANLYDYQPSQSPDNLLEIDQWIVEQTDALAAQICKEFDEYDFNAGMVLLHNFCVRELSSFYLDAIKDRMYCDPSDSTTRRSAQAACHRILVTLTKLISPILCHTAEEVYERVPLTDRKPTVFIEEFHPVETSSPANLAQRFARLVSFRDNLYIALEQWKHTSGVKDTQDVLLTVSGDDELLRFLESFGTDLPNLLKVSSVQTRPSSQTEFHFAMSTFDKCERCRLRRQDVILVDNTLLCFRCKNAIDL